MFKKYNYPPPLYFMLLAFWRVFGDSEFILRLLSVIFGIGSVVGIYFLGKVFFDAKTAIISSFILALAPFHIYYSQELTMYSLFSFSILLAVLCFKKALKYERWSFWIGFSIFSVLSILTHYIAILILFAEIVFFLLFWREYKNLFNKWIKSHLLILLLISPWLPLIIGHTVFGINSSLGFWIFWLPPLSWQTIIITLKNFSIGYNATPSVFWVASTVYFILFILGIYSTKKKSDLFLLLFLIFIPMFLALVFYKFKVGVYVDRYFLPGALFYYLIIAKGLSNFKKNIILSIVTLSIAISNSFTLKNYYLDYLPNLIYHHIGVQKKLDFRSAAYYIAENFQEGDIIIHTNENSIFPLEYYLTSRRFYNLKNFSFFSKEG
ncbi:MAG: glycosyltransferase family 39 protein, partial [Candidatus Omnitrophica bacterium]|nr:glycosyltransferase family 39 protein [Candidatus Omnitrophota bacterium]